MCIMAYFFTSSIPWGETSVQPQGQVPIAPILTVSTPFYLSHETDMKIAWREIDPGETFIWRLISPGFTSA